MRKTIIAYILSCIEEIQDNELLGEQIRILQDKIYDEIEKDPDDLLNVLFLYTIVFESDYQLGLETRKIYNEITYFFDGYTKYTGTNSH